MRDLEASVEVALDSLNLSDEVTSFLEEQSQKILEHSFNEIILADFSQSKIDSFYVELMITDDAYITEVNKSYRNINKATNVISLQSYAKDEITEMQSGICFLGNIFISYNTLLKEAKEEEIELGDHLARLITHGLLHLVGYDHEEELEAKEMNAMEEKILEGLNLKSKSGLTNNYWNN